MFSMIFSFALAATAANGIDNPPAKPAKPKKVCERVEGGLGSRVSQRVCRVVEPAETKEKGAEASAEKPAGSATN
ncbi:MAG: hypothetical protein WA940_18010 [Sphingopyxis sp.]|jgi:hypothetical protein